MLKQLDAFHSWMWLGRKINVSKKSYRDSPKESEMAQSLLWESENPRHLDTVNERWSGHRIWVVEVPRRGSDGPLGKRSYWLSPLKLLIPVFSPEPQTVADPYPRSASRRAIQTEALSKWLQMHMRSMHPSPPTDTLPARRRVPSRTNTF